MNICPFFEKDLGCRLAKDKKVPYGCGEKSLETATYYYKECEWYKRYHPEAKK